MPAPHDLSFEARTDEERIEDNRYDAYHAFEQHDPGHPMVSRQQFSGWLVRRDA